MFVVFVATSSMMSHSLSVEKLKQINPRFHLIVFGFIREAQHKLFGSEEHSFYIIPELVAYITLDFYFERVFWEPINRIFTLSEDKKTLTRGHYVQGWNNTSFVNVEVDSMQQCIAKWTLRIDKSRPRNHIMIGIIGGRSSTDKGMFEENDYAYWGATGQSKKGKGNWKRYGALFSDNDVIECILDLKRRQVSFDKNGEKQGVACRAIICREGIKYRLGVSMYFGGFSCSIIDFQQTG